MKFKNIVATFVFFVTFSVFLSKGVCFDAAFIQCENLNEKQEYKKAAKCYSSILKNNKSNQILTLGQRYKQIEISMSKKHVLDLLGEPTKKKAISHKAGVFECWRWNTSPYANYENLRDVHNAPSLLFLNGRVAQTGLDYCPNF